MGKNYIKISDRDIYAIETLFKCNIKPMTMKKKWVNMIYHLSRTTHRLISHQINDIWRLIYEFRNQIKDKDLVEEARKKL